MAVASRGDLLKSLKADCREYPAKSSQDGHENGEDLAILNMGGGRNYSLDELVKVRRRPFASRWFITAISIDWKAVWLRSHFSDDAEMITPTRRIRDLVKATITEKSSSLVAKSILADTLTSWFEMEPSNYLSMASMMGSVLSNWGDGVTFETIGDPNHDSKAGQLFMIKTEAEQEISRLRFTRILNILFEKVSIEAFLVKNENANIYRLTYCLTHASHHKRDPTFLIALIATVSAFLIQITFVGFVIIENYNHAAEPDGRYVKKVQMVILAILTFALSSLLGYPEIKNFVETNSFYGLTKDTGGWFGLGGWGLVLSLMDSVANMILPFVLTISGFLLILIQEDYIDAVLNSTALLFILEIDDLLPTVLQLDPVSIVRNFLIGAAVQELGEVLKLYEKDNKTLSAAFDTSEVEVKSPKKKESLVKVADAERKLLQGDYHIPKIEYADMLLTNSAEKGTDLPDSFIFAPYEIQGDPGNPAVSNSNYVTSNCLLRRIEWRYTYNYPRSRKPRVGLLKVWKLEGGLDYVLLNYEQEDAPESTSAPVVVDPHKMIDDPHYSRVKGLAEMHPDLETLTEDENERLVRDLDSMNTIYAVEGVYMITVFEVSETMLRLRICGSKKAEDFKNAMGAYALWDLDATANTLISRQP